MLGCKKVSSAGYKSRVERNWRRVPKSASNVAGGKSAIEGRSAAFMSSSKVGESILSMTELRIVGCLATRMQTSGEVVRKLMRMMRMRTEEK